MKSTLVCLSVMSAACALAHTQVVPAATSGSATLSASFRYSQSAEFAQDYGDWQTATSSGDVTYANGSARHPRMLNYAGGYTWKLAGAPYSSGFFQRLAISQGMLWKHWSLSLSDDVSERPQAPTTGFSGVAGTGEPIASVPSASQSILTVNTRTVDNLATIQLADRLSAATSLSVDAASELMRFPDGNGLDTDTLTLGGAVTRRLNARNNASAQYALSRFTYPDNGLSIDSSSPMFGFTRAWNRTTSTNISVGPEWVSSNNKSAIPSSTVLSINAGIAYQLHQGMAAFSYSRGTEGGSGLMVGSTADSLSASLSREIQKQFTVEATADYRRTQGLGTKGVVDSKIAAVQASTQLSRHLSCFASYTAATQSSSAQLPSNALSQLIQTASFGMVYSPRDSRHNQ
jgi:hypothetical protein